MGKQVQVEELKSWTIMVYEPGTLQLLTSETVYSRYALKTRRRVHADNGKCVLVTEDDNT